MDFSFNISIIDKKKYTFSLHENNESIHAHKKIRNHNNISCLCFPRYQSEKSLNNTVMMFGISEYIDKQIKRKIGS